MGYINVMVIVYRVVSFCSIVYMWRRPVEESVCFQ